jgi:hypothetical protein
LKALKLQTDTISNFLKPHIFNTNLVLRGDFSNEKFNGTYFWGIEIVYLSKDVPKD